MALSLGELTAIGIGLGNIAAWSKLIYDARKNGKGNNKFCPSHIEVTSEIGINKTMIEKIEKDFDLFHTENRQDHSYILDKISALTTVIANATSAAAASAAVVASSAAMTKREKKRD